MLVRRRYDGIPRLCVLARHCVQAALFLLTITSCTTVWAGERVRVGIYENSPKVGTGESGKPEGIFVDLIEAIADNEGWKLEYVSGTWNEGLARLAAGEIDLMPDVALTDERKQLYAFHREPVLSSWNQVYAWHGSGIRSLPDLEGRRVAVLEGSVQQEFFKDMMGSFGLNVVLVPQPDFGTAFRAVANGDAEAVVTNRFYGMHHASASGLEDTAVIFNPSRLYFAAPKHGNPALLLTIDRHLLTFKKNSTSIYYRSLRRWSDEDLGPAVPTWLTGTALTAVALLLVSMGWGVTLRRTTIRLRASEQRQRQLADEQTMLLENIRVGILFTGDGRILRANPRLCELFGYGDSADLINNDITILFSDADDARSFFRLVSPTLAAGEIVDIEWRGKRRDGSHFLGHTIARAIAVPGYRLATIWMVEDVTEKRAAAKTLLAAKHAAEAADRLKSAFLATMSHELRTPLNSIIGFTGIVLQELPGPLNAEQKKQLNMVQDSARHLLALINDVLDISRIEAGELEVVSVSFDLAAAIAKVIGIVTPLAEKKGLVLRVEGAEKAGILVGDARRVEQILLNLLNNAVKFTEAGTITLSANNTGDYTETGVETVQLRVADTGIGIKPKDMAQIFQPFRQVDSALTRKHEGTGLGLAICRRLAEIMEGHIEAESRFGEGSVFTLTLPRYPPMDKEAT